jgi:hypothetical protein
MLRIEGDLRVAFFVSAGGEQLAVICDWSAWLQPGCDLRWVRVAPAAPCDLRSYNCRVAVQAIGKLSNRLDTRTVGNRFRSFCNFCDSALGAQALWPACDWSAGPCDYSDTCDP